jgi:hypothetical protein
MNTITALQLALGICVFVAAMFSILWQMAKVDADNQASAAEHFEKLSQTNATERTKWKRECEDLSAKLLKANGHLNRAYIRNRFGVWQRFREWEAIGDKEPRPRKPKMTVSEMGDYFLQETEKLKNQRA